MVAERAAHRDLIDRPITDVMSCPVFSVSVRLSLGEVLEAMVQTGFRHLVVVDDVRRCLGVVGDRAVTAAWASDPSALSVMHVGRILDPRPAVVAHDATVGEVARALYVDRVDAVAVMDRSGAPVGMVTAGDLVALMAGQVDAARSVKDAPG